MSEFDKIGIKRWHYGKDFTVGELRYRDFQCFTLELPDLDNQSYISCIPEGLYTFHTRLSNRNGFVIELDHVEDRTHIQIHSGNYTSQILGCILVGDAIKHMNNDSIPDVSNSKNTLGKLLKLVGDSGEVRIKS